MYHESGLTQPTLIPRGQSSWTFFRVSDTQSHSCSFDLTLYQPVVNLNNLKAHFPFLEYIQLIFELKLQVISVKCHGVVKQNDS